MQPEQRSYLVKRTRVVVDQTHILSDSDGAALRIAEKGDSYLDWVGESTESCICEVLERFELETGAAARQELWEPGEQDVVEILGEAA